MNKRQINEMDDSDTKKKLKSDEITVTLIGYAYLYDGGRRITIKIEIPGNAVTDLYRENVYDRECALFTTNLAKVIDIYDDERKYKNYHVDYKPTDNSHSVGSTYNKKFEFYLTDKPIKLMENKNGIIKRYHKSGKLQMKFRRVDGKIEGICNEYHDNKSDELIISENQHMKMNI